MKLRSGTPEEAKVSTSNVRRIRERAASWVDEGVHQGLVILAARKGIVFLHDAFGKLTPDDDSPSLPLDAIFPLASLTKPITSTAVIILVEDGLVGLNRPVQDYIPEFIGEGKDKVLVHHLLTHADGLESGVIEAVYAEKEATSVELPPHDETQHPLVHRYLHYGLDAPLTSKPGTEMVYSGYAYQLLGEIIRRTIRRSVDNFVKERNFEPLGMNDSYYSIPKTIRQRIVKRPPKAPFTEFNTDEFQEMPIASAGVYSTAMDMAIFGQMFLNQGKYGDERILSPVTVAAMTRNQIPGIKARFIQENFPETAWGLGWSINSEFKGSVYGEALLPATSYLHGGAGGVLLWVGPEHDIIGVYLSVGMELLEGEGLLNGAQTCL